MSVPVQVRPSAPKKSSGNIALFYFIFNYRHFCFTKPCLVTLEQRSRYSVASLLTSPATRTKEESRNVISFLFYFSLPALLFRLCFTKPCLVTLEQCSRYSVALLLTSPATRTKEIVETLSFFIFNIFITGTFVSLMLHKTVPYYNFHLLSFSKKLKFSSLTSM